MSTDSPNRRPPLRAVLDMARAGNLPSVASNVIAALVLSGAGGMGWPSGGQLVQALIAGFLLYAGGATLNDVADADFDRKHRPERAIPTGVFSRNAALALGAVEMALGAAILWRAGAAPGALLGLVAVILAYDWLHKRWTGSVFLMAGCRSMLGVSLATLPGHAAGPWFWAWTAAVFAYIVVLSLLARMEYKQGGGEALTDLLAGLRDLVEGVGEGLDILALQRGHEGLAKFLGDREADALVVAPGHDQLGEALLEVRLADLRVKLGEGLGAFRGLIGAGFEQLVEFLILTEDLLEEVFHGRLVGWGF